MENSKYKIVGYLADWQDWSAESIDAGKMTHINYAFAQIKDGLVCMNENNRLGEVKRLKKLFPNLRILISIGGWGAEGFSDAAQTEASRGRFADSALAFITSHGFDGVDLDWEYPCLSEAGIKSTPDDKHNFTRLLQKVRQKLDEAEMRDHRRYWLTIASGAMQEHVSHLELDLISEVTDFINVMAYDFHSGLSSFAGHHANLYTSICDDGDRMSVDKAVKEHICAGVPAGKLVLGCAFYGRGWRVVEAENHGLYEFSGDDRSEHSYSSLSPEYIAKNGYERFWDETAKAPYLWNGERFISYEDTESLGHKTSYIKAKGLAGAMFWEYTQDDKNILLNKLYNDLNK
ncbi:MAG: glycoside hydrolase family 18 protein [Clostridia bacterium]|nr:glycoside hydrolase family 18 protein [Clostridia bacterium]